MSARGRSPEEILVELAERMVDGNASEHDVARLEELLRDDENLRYYLRFAALDAQLELTNRESSWPAAVEEDELPTAAAQARRPRIRWAAAVPWGIAIVAVITSVGLLWQARQPVARDPAGVVAQRASPAKDSIAALLVDEVGAEFAPGRGPDEVRFGPGEYELLSGVVHLRFARGVDLVLASPARLHVADSMHTRLDYGAVRVIAPPSGEGFTISAPAADYVDLGTEFGLRVERGSGASDLYVFEGQVNIESPDSKQMLSEVLEGDSSRRVDGVAGEAPPLKMEDFPAPGTIGFLRWQQYEQRLRQTPGLLAFFLMQRTADEAVLTNAAENEAIGDGRIAGARWVSGRWPGKEALFFDRDTDFVEIDVAGEYRELTTAVWLKLDRLDYGMNAIFNSNGSDDGVAHFQMTRQGLPRGGVMGTDVTSDTFYGHLVPVGNWVHLVSVISSSDRSACFYINGKLALRRELRTECVIRPGACRLGNWLSNATAWSPRALRGRIDELSLWDRALSRQEIQRLVEDGRPGMLWNSEESNSK